MLEEMVWRIVPLEKRDGYFNTALDEAMLNLISGGESPATLVFTEWKPTVSVGRAQSVELDVDEEACRKHGAALVRRQSGGQAVYVDEGYIVMSLIGQRKFFPASLDGLRESISVTLANVLQEYGVPCRFFPPDNVVIGQQGLKTLGNSGQLIRGGKDGIVSVHASIRHDFLHFDEMLEMLKMNGYSLQSYRKEVRDVLSSVKMYSDVGKEELKGSLIRAFMKLFGTRGEEGKLSSLEEQYIQELASEKYRDPLWTKGDCPTKSVGVCYFFLNGKNIVPALENFLPYHEPSGLQEAMSA